MILGVLLGDGERASPDLTKGEVGFELRLRLVEEGILVNEERISFYLFSLVFRLGKRRELTRLQNIFDIASNPKTSTSV